MIKVTTNKFLSIYTELTEQIKEGKLPVNSLLPSENDLAVEYDVSRETIRKALNLLSQNGYIQKIRGKGSVVLDVGRFNFPVSGLVSFKEIADSSHQQWKTTVHELVLIKPDEVVRKNLQLEKDEEVWRIVRSREIEGERIILDIDYLSKRFIPTITKDICEDSLYDYFEKELDLVISFAKKEITVEPATEEDRRYLDLHDMDYVVVVKNIVYLEDASHLQFTLSRHRLDKFRFVDFARRERNS